MIIVDIELNYKSFKLKKKLPLLTKKHTHTHILKNEKIE